MTLVKSEAEAITSVPAIPVYDSPTTLMEMAKEWATTLMAAVQEQKMSAEIQGEEYLEVEAWQLVGLFANAHAVAEQPTPVLGDNKQVIAYECVAHVYQGDQIVSKGASICGMNAFVTKGKFGYDINRAAMSAAQTWAISKAYRNRFAFVAKLAGFKGTTAEEMQEAHEDRQVQRPGPRPSAPPTQQDGFTPEWCPEHNTDWFQKGRMQSPAHPINDSNGEQSMNPSTGKPLWCNMNQWLENLGQRAVALGLDADQTREYMDANIPDKWSIVMSGEWASPDQQGPSDEGATTNELWEREA